MYSCSGSVNGACGADHLNRVHKDTFSCLYAIGGYTSYIEAQWSRTFFFLGMAEGCGRRCWCGG